LTQRAQICGCGYPSEWQRGSLLCSHEAFMMSTREATYTVHWGCQCFNSFGFLLELPPESICKP
jgi:hypothetical protein